MGVGRCLSYIHSGYIHVEDIVCTLCIENHSSSSKFQVVVYRWDPCSVSGTRLATHDLGLSLGIVGLMP